MTGFECSKIAFGLKLHFTAKYDYFRYGPKKPFNNQGKFQFEKLAKKYTNQLEFENFLVANWLERDVAWAGNLLDDEAAQHFTEWKRRTQALGYQFAQDCDVLLAKSANFDDLFRPVAEGENPPVLQALLWREICPETFIVLEQLLGFFAVFDKKLADPMGQWAAIKLRCLKYQPFLNRTGVDIEKMRLIIREKLGKSSAANGA